MWRSDLPLGRAFGNVGAEGARAHRVREVAAERWMHSLDLGDAVLDSIRHGLAHSLRVVARLAGASAEPVRRRELARDEVDLGVGLRGALVVTERHRFLALLAQLV